MNPAGAHVGLKIIERPRAVEASLWRRLRYENEAQCREALFDLYHSLARAVARHEHRRRPPYGLDRLDFEHLAYGGLLEAIDRFDPLRGAPFDAYARRRIRGAISDGLARSSEIAAQYSQRRRAETDRLRSLEIGAEEPQDFIRELSNVATALAIGFIVEGASLTGDGTGSTQPDSYESVAWGELYASLQREIALLPERQRSVMQQHYVQGVSFAHIADMLGVTKGRVSQLHRDGIRRIRERLRSNE